MLEMRSMASFIVWLRGVCARGRWCINSCYPGDAYNPHSGPHSEGMRIVRGCVRSGFVHTWPSGVRSGFVHTWPSGQSSRGVVQR